MTISELMLSATPSILIPLPHAIDNHQFYNAKILADNNAGILIEQKHLTIQTLEKILLSLDKEKLESMSNHTLALAKPNAARDIVERLLDI
jgi:UDP-N-acetylglucosamine--N-acetylmuramyl-(pentapeptide) pyrophosphoryl-undecaprenol N-acetylglucosamine transferase